MLARLSLKSNIYMSNSGKVVVTGIGIISAIGNNLSETYESLVSAHSGIREITILNTIHKK